MAGTGTSQASRSISTSSSTTRSSQAGGPHADINGFLGNWGPNNSSIYRFEGDTQSVFFLWDKGLSFYELYHAIFTELERSVLGQRVMAVPALRRLDLDTLLACAASDAEPDQPAQPDQEEPPVSWFEAELLRERAQILDAARADRMKPCTNERADEAHEGLLPFARHRRAYVTGQVERGCSPPSSEPGRTLPDFGHPRRPERSYTSTGFMARARLNSAPRAGHEAMSGPHRRLTLAKAGGRRAWGFRPLPPEGRRLS